MVAKNITRDSESRRDEFERELNALQEERSARWQDYLSRAREDGATDGTSADLRQVVAYLDWRIERLTEALARAELTEQAPQLPGVAGLGSSVKVRWPDGLEEQYTLVTPLESDPARGRLSCEAPLGQALIGSQAGDTVEAQAPEGPLQLDVLLVA